jgi:23S rRNA pseudouridine2605 synthase
MPIGRLDWNSEGLLLLTNDGELKRHLELPATAWIRRYRVRAFGDPPDGPTIARLARGIEIDGVRYDGIETTIDRRQGGNVWLTMALREGKNREIRRVLSHLGLEVNRLIRVSYGAFQLGQLVPGAVEEVPARALRDLVGGEFGKAPARR